MAKRGRYYAGMFDAIPQSPAEAFVEAGAPEDLARVEEAMADFDSEGNAIRPWEPKGEEGIGAPPKETVENGTLTAGGSPPFKGMPPGRWEKE